MVNATVVALFALSARRGGAGFHRRPHASRTLAQNGALLRNGMQHAVGKSNGRPGTSRPRPVARPTAPTAYFT
ncbi:hypothetical protein [uncultured Croceicoccus sp.]|uniref:hypothetical protein n=1 Tax=uncultured Croceicoccus sp. TaxID=1295329 RepID=UPI00260EF6DB|nr:hypothetical protein [uncultured Croceicoccus sp.]